jgi:hypothetical protein
MTTEPQEEQERRRFSMRDEVWGDEPQEVDASELVQEIEATRPELVQRWHVHPAVGPFKVD